MELLAAIIRAGMKSAYYIEDIVLPDGSFDAMYDVGAIKNIEGLEIAFRFDSRDLMHPDIMDWGTDLPDSHYSTDGWKELVA